MRAHTHSGSVMFLNRHFLLMDSGHKWLFVTHTSHNILFNHKATQTLNPLRGNQTWLKFGPKIVWANLDFIRLKIPFKHRHTSFFKPILLKVNQKSFFEQFSSSAFVSVCLVCMKGICENVSIIVDLPLISYLGEVFTKYKVHVNFCPEYIIANCPCLQLQ